MGTLGAVSGSLGSPERHAQSRVGAVLPGGYTLLAVVGVGGAAAVFEARDASGATVAVKVLHPHARTNDALVRRFQREPALVATVDHPGVVPILATGTDGDLPFLVMPLLQGETLEELRARRGGTLPVAEAARYAVALLEILAAVHAAGVVHRDVKPANVFCETDGRVRLLDFGLAGRVGGGRDDDGLDDDALSLADDDELLGTLAFMAPEQAAGRRSDVGPRSDLFAVGATLSKLMSARDVHEGTTKHERLLNAATRPVPKLTTRFPEASPELAALLDRALSFHPAARFSDAKAMAAALAALDASDAAPNVTRSVREPERRRGFGLVAALVVAAVAGSLVWAPWSNEAGPRVAVRDRIAREEPARDALAIRRDRSEDRGSVVSAVPSSASLRPVPAPTAVVAAERPDPMDIRR